MNLRRLVSRTVEGGGKQAFDDVENVRCDRGAVNGGLCLVWESKELLASAGRPAVDVVDSSDAELAATVADSCKDASFGAAPVLPLRPW